PKTSYSRELRKATPSPEVEAALTRVAAEFAERPGVAAAGLTAAQFQTLFRAMIQHESGFNPRAVSPKGAMGLGQIMPATARALALDKPFEIEPNLRAAALYLTRQLEAFKAPELALAAYNAGPDAVRAYGGIPNFPETQAYVAAIMSVLKR
ncbi:MAG: lytic transglycosylase domain-containing protein, partial [Pseudomonadota bacterium]